MKRRLGTLLVFLLLGAVINIAVAWGLALWRPFEANVMRSPPSRTSGWPIRPPADFPLNARNYSNSTWQHLRRERWASENVGPHGYSLDHVSAGWPMRSMHGGRWQSFAPNAIQPLPNNGYAWAIETSFNPNIWVMTYQQGFYLPGQTPAAPVTTTSVVNRLVPFRPLFPGFAINTLLYAVLAWLLLAAPFALRRAIRRRRHLCARCAYPIGTSERCTECGAPLM